MLQPPAHPATGLRAHLRSHVTELRAIGGHAGTVLAGQLAVMAYGVTDTLVAGRHSTAALATLAVGTAVYVSVYISLMSVVQALLPLWAELHGARQPQRVGPSVRQALYLCLLTSALGMALLLAPGPLLNAAGVPTHLQAETMRYLGVLAWALPPALLFRLFSTLSQSLGRSRLVSALQIGSLGLKVPLSIWLTFGGAGLPSQGAAGCAWATLAVNLALLTCALWLSRRQAFFGPYALWRRIEPPDVRQLRTFLQLGLLAGLAVMVEVSAFTGMALFISRMGNNAAAAHQIASNMAAVLYMAPLSLGIAASARVSWWLGAGQPRRASAAAWLGLGMALGMALLLSATLALLATPIAKLYTRDDAVAHMAAGLLAWVALHHLGDAVQAVALFVLRSWRVTIRTLAIYGVLLWGMGLAGGYHWAFHGLGPLPPWPDPGAFWLAAACALALVTLLFVALLAHITRTACRTGPEASAPPT